MIESPRKSFFFSKPLLFLEKRPLKNTLCALILWSRGPWTFSVDACTPQEGLGAVASVTHKPSEVSGMPSPRAAESGALLTWAYSLWPLMCF